MIVSSTITSVYSVGLIAIDRFLYIIYGLQYQRWVYPNRARLLICLTWIIGMFVVVFFFQFIFKLISSKATESYFGLVELKSLRILWVLISTCLIPDS